MPTASSGVLSLYETYDLPIAITGTDDFNIVIDHTNDPIKIQFAATTTGATHQSLCGDVSYTLTVSDGSTDYVTYDNTDVNRVLEVWKTVSQTEKSLEITVKAQNSYDQ